ncbi:MAG: CHAT domain-containing protein, partial [Burkholderiales bacterium]|nr:CHAT domain-containing protein [Burkholderiales bacterium]
MFDNFKLIITPQQTCANLCLLNASGEVLGQHLAKLDQLTLSERHALFDLHTYLHTYVAPEEQLAAMAEIGVCIAMQVMGEQIFDCLWQDDGMHSVQICLPPPHATPQSSQANEELAQLAAFARLPWELARKNRLSPSLAQRNFRFCIEHQDHPQKTRALSKSLPLVPLQAGDALRVLFIFAQAQDSHIMVLSACHSGNVPTARWWQSGAGLKHERGIPAAPQKEIELPAKHSLSGVAHALLQAGVPNILAMRFAVGDDYARELALAMYQQYFLGAEQLNLALALCVARQSLLVPNWQDKFSVCDHATAVLFSQTQSNLPLSSVNASTKGGKNRLRPSTVFDANSYFVGRVQALAALAAACSQSSTAGGRRKNNASVLQIIGLGGMGKTTLAAEALDLWQSQFDWVVEFHGKTDHLSVEFVLAEIHWRLQNQLGVYHAHVQAFSADAIYRPATPQFQGRSRLQRLMQNLLRALRDEAFLLIFDNLESVLEDEPTRTLPVQQTEQPVWHCRDTQFDSLLQTITKGLLGSRSRLLVTTRKPLAALQRYCQQIVLGPLPLAEAKIFLRQFPVLMSVSSAAPEHLDSAENAHIIAQILAASRGHPLLLDRLARMANMPDQQHALARLLQQLQRPLGERNFAGLPESLSALHIAQGEQVRQLRYLENALIESLDQLIVQQTQATCYLLWLIALANDAI